MVTHLVARHGISDVPKDKTSHVHPLVLQHVLEGTADGESWVHGRTSIGRKTAGYVLFALIIRVFTFNTFRQDKFTACLHYRLV